MKVQFGNIKFSAGLLILTSMSLILAACGDTSTPSSANSNITTPPNTTSTTMTTATTTSNTTTAAITTNPAITVATTATTPSSAATVTNSPTSNAPAWFNTVPTYTNATPLSLDAATLKAINVDPTKFYAEAFTTSDTVTSILDFYTSKLTAANWQVARKSLLSTDANAGAQLTLTRTENGTTEVLVVLAGTAAALKSIPQTAAFGSKIPDGQNAILLLAQTASATTITPVAPSTTNLPAGVAAQNISFDFGDGWVAQGQITYPAGKTGSFPTVILVHGSGTNDMDETISQDVAGVSGGSNFSATSLTICPHAVLRSCVTISGA